MTEYQRATKVHVLLDFYVHFPKEEEYVLKLAEQIGMLIQVQESIKNYKIYQKAWNKYLRQHKKLNEHHSRTRR